MWVCTCNLRYVGIYVLVGGLRNVGTGFKVCGYVLVY